jgi:glycosyltransferase involved in cell wall biosynthesis
MRLVYVYDTWLPTADASAVNVFKTSESLAAEGHEVTLVHFGRARPDFQHYGVHTAFSTLALPVRPGRAGAVRMLGWAAALLARMTGATVYSRKPALLVPAARLGCPVALEIHAPFDADHPRNRASLSWLVERKQLQSILCISEALARWCTRTWPEAADRIMIARDGADAGPAPEPPPRRRSKRPLLGYAGHLYPGKGMEIIAELARLRPDWDFLVLGGRPDDVEQWRNSTAQQSNIEFTGMVQHAQVRARLASSDLVLAPYAETVIVSDGRLDVAKWMSPLKLFEYMAMAKPIVASDLPVIREVLHDGVNGRLAVAGDAKDWERVIGELLNDLPAAAEIGRRARADLERNYTWQRRARIIAGALR